MSQKVIKIFVSIILMFNVMISTAWCMGRSRPVTVRNASESIGISVGRGRIPSLYLEPNPCLAGCGECVSIVLSQPADRSSPSVAPVESPAGSVSSSATGTADSASQSTAANQSTELNIPLCISCTWTIGENYPNGVALSDGQSIQFVCPGMPAGQEVVAQVSGKVGLTCGGSDEHKGFNTAELRVNPTADQSSLVVTANTISRDISGRDPRWPFLLSARATIPGAQTSVSTIIKESLRLNLTSLQTSCWPTVSGDGVYSADTTISVRLTDEVINRYRSLVR